MPSSYDGGLDDMTLDADLLYGPTPTHGDNHPLMLASSGYYPPPVVTAMINDRASMGSYSYVARRPGVGPSGFDDNGDWLVNPNTSVLTYAYSTPQYVLGTAELEPGVKHVAPSRQNRWQGIIFNTTSADRVYPQAGPPSFNPANDSFLSVQSKNTLITRKQADLGESTYVYFSKTLDTLAEKKGWIFVKEGGAYLAVKPATGGYRWLTLREEQGLEQGPALHPAGQGRRADHLRSGHGLHLSDAGGVREPDTAEQVQVQRDARVHVVHAARTSRSSATSPRPPQVNGKGAGYDPPMVFNSPFMKSKFGSGKITITKGSQRRVVRLQSLQGAGEDDPLRSAG